VQFNDLLDVVQKYLVINDEHKSIIKLVVSSIVGNVIYDDLPIWLILVGSAGSGKTTLVSPFLTTEWTYPISTLTPASLLSAYDKSVSLLNKVKGKILIIKDFSTITELNQEQRNEIFSMLRDAYDGELKRATGRVEIEFTGKFGIIACATYSIEQFRKIENLLGERFLHYRMPRQDPSDLEQILARIRLTHSNKKQINMELQEAGRNYTKEILENGKIQMITDDEFNFISQISKIIIKLRASVVRDAYTKEITFPAEVSEEPQRLFKQLQTILCSLKTIDEYDIKQGGDNKISNTNIILNFLKFSIPYTRLRVLESIKQIMVNMASLDIVDSTRIENDIIADKTKISTSHCGRILEELRFLGILDNGNNIIDKELYKLL